MAEAAIMPSRLTAYTNADWYEEPFQFFNGGLGAPDDFTGASARMGLRPAGQTTNATELTTDNGYLTITPPNEVGVTAPLSVMTGLAPGLYSWDLVITYGSGDIETVLTGQLQIVQGIS